MEITIDPYYSNQFFNECKEALKNNNIDYKISINIKPPYNWYFSLDNAPSMVNYDVGNPRWNVGIVQALRPSEEYTLLRRNSDNGSKALAKFIENEPMRESRKSDYAVFFTVKNREEIESISREFPGKIWYLGKYYKNKYRICLCSHRTIKGFLEPSQILLERENTFSEPGQFEAELNYRVFRMNDELVKFTETPFFIDGKYVRPNIQGDISSRFKI